MALIIRDFDRQKIMRPSDIAEMVKALPAAHTKGLRVVLYMPAKEFAHFDAANDPACKGRYYAEFRTIILHEINSSDLLCHVLYHEIGHFVFSSVISSYDRKNWVGNLSRQDKYPTDYARRNPYEDFAECYALYASNPSNLYKCPKKRQFFQQKVF